MEQTPFGRVKGYAIDLEASGAADLSKMLGFLRSILAI
jgi:hypothetical protein